MHPKVGLRDVEDQSVPKLVVQDENIKSLHCGGQFCIITKKEEIVLLGRSIGEITPNINSNSVKQIVCGLVHALFLCKNGEVHSLGNNQFVLSQVNPAHFQL